MEFVLFPVWAAGAWNVGDIAVHNNSPWVAQNPATTQVPTDYPWLEYTGQTYIPLYVPGAPYYPGELIKGPNGILYLNLADNNTSVPPNATWRAIAGASTLPALSFSPLRYTTNTFPAVGKNVFPLPPSYLRPMAQDPKAAGTAAQIVTGGAQALDYEIEQGQLLTAADGPLVFRFGADIQIVQSLDDLLCEAIAARMALELNETITQSPQKATMLNSLYEEAIAKAVRLNAIEAGSTEPETDKVDSQRGPTREKAMQPRQPQQ